MSMLQQNGGKRKSKARTFQRFHKAESDIVAAITKMYLNVAVVAATKGFAGAMVKQMVHKLADNGQIKGDFPVTVCG